MPVRVEATSCTALAFEMHKLAAAVASQVATRKDVLDLIKRRSFFNKYTYQIICPEIEAMQANTIIISPFYELHMFTTSNTHYMDAI